MDQIIEDHITISGIDNFTVVIDVDATFETVQIILYVNRRALMLACKGCLYYSQSTTVGLN